MRENMIYSCITHRRVAQQQLQALISLIPNITKTNRRSVLEATLDYLQKINDETVEIEKELTTRSANPILGVETEEIAEGEFSVNISWKKKKKGVAGHVQRMFESLDLRVSSVEVHERSSNEMITKAFLKVKHGMITTEEELHDQIMTRFGM